MLRSISAFLLLTALAGKASADNIPDIVLEYASAFAQTQAADKQPSATPPADYAQWFFQGLTHPAGAIVTQSALMRDAYTKGQEYWRDHPSQRTQIMAGYGYRPIERDGVWSRGFEKSVFQPTDADADAGTWWINSFGGVAWREVGLVAPNSVYERPRVHIAGYLSPKGHYGHLGAYEHEVLVTSGAAEKASGH
ncbi:hypothetical protein IGS59_11745 [Janthinobacterium sp. GW460P]|uniref:hypothetical protein n=1 Tax=unclassified Janthinobacterium TaxID=2610881 RepID=UPI000A3295C4|nr:MULTISPECIES: hypothetical protein [unclassified Janthinobacterium]MCC7702919.1 hypothetical protein [Janthinobacterium sp. GW460P]MCC7708427.1 hypothetical protein [Janthinobacterium sp. GW460W]